jgi:hypothetical protein
VVVVDGDSLGFRATSLIDEYGAQAVPVDVPPGPSAVRVAKLRATALALVADQWLAWLDDDNWWEPDHLRSLLDTAVRADGALPHSYRRLWRDGCRYRGVRNPWQHDRRRERLHRDHLARQGVRRPRSPLMRDRLFEAPFDGYHGTIDLGEWLFPPGVAPGLGMPVPTSDGRLGEDDLLLGRIVRAGLAPASTGQFTLNYTIGAGVSATLGGRS